MKLEATIYSDPISRIGMEARHTGGPCNSMCLWFQVKRHDSKARQTAIAVTPLIVHHFAV